MGKPLLVTASIYLIFGCNHHCFYCSNLSNFFDDVHVFHRTCSFFSPTCFSLHVEIISSSSSIYRESRSWVLDRAFLMKTESRDVGLSSNVFAYIWKNSLVPLWKNIAGLLCWSPVVAMRRFVRRRAPLASFSLHKNRFCFCHWMIN